MEKKQKRTRHWKATTTKKLDCTLTLKNLAVVANHWAFKRKKIKKPNCKAAGRQAFGFLVFQLEKFYSLGTLGSFYIKTVRNYFFL